MDMLEVHEVSVEAIIARAHARPWTLSLSCFFTYQPASDKDA